MLGCSHIKNFFAACIGTLFRKRSQKRECFGVSCLLLPKSKEKRDLVNVNINAKNLVLEQ